MTKPTMPELTSRRPASRAGRVARGRRFRGFSLVELLVVVLIIALLIGILVPAVGGVRQRAKLIRDQSQLRNIVQGLATWAGSNDQTYPLPSLIDRADATVTASQPYQKDNTGNILSVMIWNRIVPVEALVSPAEVNVNIAPDTRYQFETPEAAVDPSRAVFDPGFAGVPFEAGTATGGGRRGGNEAVGGTSYAHVIPFGPRQGQWKPVTQQARPVFASRGPEYIGLAGNWALRPGATGTNSNTLRIFGRSNAWRGNVAWNDGRVTNFPRPDFVELKFHFSSAPGGASDLPDNIFVNENDQNGAASLEQNPGQNENTFLRPFSNVQANGTRRTDARITTFID